MKKIKPCPFCHSVNVELHRNFDYVHCKDCGATSSYFDGHPEDAINTWNHLQSYSESTIKTQGSYSLKQTNLIQSYINLSGKDKGIFIYKLRKNYREFGFDFCGVAKTLEISLWFFNIIICW